MSNLEQKILERIGNLEILLPQRFAHRSLTRALKYSSNFRHIDGPTGEDAIFSSHSNCVVGGLEVQFTSGSSVQILGGGAICKRPAVPGSPTATSFPPSETRPGTWSGNDEEDYDSGVFCELPNPVTVAPATPIATATTNFEWWLVYAEPIYPVLESDSNRKVFNQSTGIFNATGAAKVSGHRLAVTVLRGSPGVAPVAFGDEILGLAWIYVPVGSTDLSTCVIYDVRRMAELDQQPNEIGGHWQANPATSGTNVSQDETVMSGFVTARLNGERLYARITNVSSVASIAEPGATWDSGASTTAPKIAWLYLCKVRGLVPRPSRRGSHAIPFNGGFPNDGQDIINGALVLSPTPPRSATFEGNKDMRPNGALALSSWTPAGGIPYVYAGITAPGDDCICVGFVRYTSLLSGLPVMFGVLTVGADGWMTGGMIDSNHFGFQPPDSTGWLAGNGLPPANLVTITAGQVAPISGASASSAALVVAGNTGVGSQPFLACRIALTNNITVAADHELFGAGAFGGYYQQISSTQLASVPPTEFHLPVGYGQITAESACLGHDVFAELRGVKLPYGVALVT